MKTVTGVFDDADSALRVGERLRELGGPRATVHVFLSGANGSVIETSIVNTDGRGVLRVSLMGLVLGVIGAVIFEAAGASWGMALFGLLFCAAFGVMIGVWLQGEAYPRRIIAGDRSRVHYARELARGRAVVTAMIAYHLAERAEDEMEAEGGRVLDGFLHDHPSLDDERLQPT